MDAQLSSGNVHFAVAACCKVTNLLIRSGVGRIEGVVYLQQHLNYPHARGDTRPVNVTDAEVCVFVLDLFIHRRNGRAF